jgi:hypothetical protein
MKYRVKTAFIGVHCEKNGTSEFVTLEPGTVFTVRSTIRGGFVNIMHQTRILSVFMRDVEERAVKVDEAHR